jgi:hypothetical protein
MPTQRQVAYSGSMKVSSWFLGISIFGAAPYSDS